MLVSAQGPGGEEEEEEEQEEGLRKFVIGGVSI